jgi:hypothetical protein
MEHLINTYQVTLLEKIRAGLAAYGYTLEIDQDRVEFVIIAVGTGLNYYVRCSDLTTFENTCAANGLPIAFKHPTTTFAKPIYAVKGQEKIFVGLDGVEPKVQYSTTYFELSWLLPPHMRLAALRSDWQEPVHQAATELDFKHYFNLEDIRSKSIRDDSSSLVDVYMSAYAHMYEDFSKIVNKHLTSELATHYHTHEKSIVGVLRENHNLIAPLICSVLGMTVVKILDLMPRLHQIPAAKEIDYTSFRKFIRALGIGANGSLGSGGQGLEGLHFDVVPKMIDGKRLFSLELNPAWQEHLESVDKTDRHIRETFRKAYFALLPCSSFALSCFTRAGFDHANTGVCPIYFESPGLAHAYDVWVDALEYLVGEWGQESYLP